MTRFDICEGYYMYASHYHASGLTNRCIETGRTITEQLDRMRFRPSPLLSEDTMSEEAWEVYNALVTRWE